jgi:hypothetical protein
VTSWEGLADALVLVTNFIRVRDPYEELQAERSLVAATDDARGLRDRKLRRIGSLEVFSVAMTQPRDVLELDDPPSCRYVVSVERCEADRTTSHAFVFRSLSVADEAKRDFERRVQTSG